MLDRRDALSLGRKCATQTNAHSCITVGRIDLADFHESFDNGVGKLNHAWGNIDTSVDGQVTLRGYAGIMERPYGAAAGHGYGTYEITAALKGNEAGSAALLWPGNDQWPGQELDFVEIRNGKPYGAAHHEKSNGGDGYRIVNYNIDESEVHTYKIEWEPGKITYSVDGREYAEFNKNVTPDHANGGVDLVFGALNNNPDTSITVYDVKYTDDVWG
jgi:hypothetical protein